MNSGNSCHADAAQLDWRLRREEPAATTAPPLHPRSSLLPVGPSSKLLPAGPQQPPSRRPPTAASFPPAACKQRYASPSRTLLYPLPLSRLLYKSLVWLCRCGCICPAPARGWLAYKTEHMLSACLVAMLSTCALAFVYTCLVAFVYPKV